VPGTKIGSGRKPPHPRDSSTGLLWMYEAIAYADIYNLHVVYLLEIVIFLENVFVYFVY